MSQPSSRSKAGVVTYVFEGQAITQRTSDGWFDATQMCRVGGKEFANYSKQEGPKKWFVTLKKALGGVKPYVSRPGQGNGSWIHPRGVIHLGMWISDEFALWVTDVVERYHHGDLSLAAEVVARHDQINNTTTAVSLSTVSNSIVVAPFPPVGTEIPPNAIIPWKVTVTEGCCPTCAIPIHAPVMDHFRFPDPEIQRQYQRLKDQAAQAEDAMAVATFNRKRNEELRKKQKKQEEAIASQAEEIVLLRATLEEAKALASAPPSYSGEGRGEGEEKAVAAPVDKNAQQPDAESAAEIARLTVENCTLLHKSKAQAETIAALESKLEQSRTNVDEQAKELKDYSNLTAKSEEQAASIAILESKLERSRMKVDEAGEQAKTLQKKYTTSKKTIEELRRAAREKEEEEGDDGDAVDRMKELHRDQISQLLELVVKAERTDSENTLLAMLADAYPSYKKRKLVVVR